MATALDDAWIAVFAHLDPDDIDAAGGAVARRLDDVVGQILANKRRAAMCEVAHRKRRELRASFNFGGPGGFRDECSVRREELRVPCAAISGSVKRIRGSRDELLDFYDIACR